MGESQDRNSSMNVESPISLLVYTALPSTKGLLAKEESRNHRETLLARWLTQARIQLVSLYIPGLVVQGMVLPILGPPMPINNQDNTPAGQSDPGSSASSAEALLSGGSRLCQVHS